MARPQCAMAHVGSAVATPRKAFSATSYAKECNKATARSKSCETFAAQDVANVTEPSLSGGGCECISCSAPPTRAERATPTATRETIRFIMRINQVLTRVDNLLPATPSLRRPEPRRAGNPFPARSRLPGLISARIHNTPRSVASGPAGPDSHAAPVGPAATTSPPECARFIGITLAHVEYHQLFGAGLATGPQLGE